MAASLRFIKSLNNPNYNILQLLTSYVFGDKDIRPYNGNKTYKKGDMIIRLNSVTNKLEILQCIALQVTGPFVEASWVKNAVNQMVGGASVNKNMVAVSLTSPQDPSNLVWYEIREFK
jgi:hypothetical protein